MLAKNLTPNFPCDLHCHTNRSDGYDTPAELIDNAARLGMKVIAITDHDVDPPLTITLADGSDVNTREYAAQQGVQIVLGDEFSTDKWVDEVHICGYELDWSHPDFVSELKAARRSKTDAYEELCKRLTQRGMPVDWWQDILTYKDPDGNLQQRSPDEVERKHIFETMARKGYAESWSAAKLLVREDTQLNVRRRKIDPLDCIRLIHRCGGTAVLAHPYLIDDVVRRPGRPACSRREYIDELIAAGLDGIEMRYTYDKTTYKGVLTPEEIEAEVRQQYTNVLPILSGGSDYHAGHKKSEKKIRSLGERGLTLDEFSGIKNFLFKNIQGA